MHEWTHDLYRVSCHSIDGALLYVIYHSVSNTATQSANHCNVKDVTVHFASLHIAWQTEIPTHLCCRAFARMLHQLKYAHSAVKCPQENPKHLVPWGYSWVNRVFWTPFWGVETPIYGHFRRFFDLKTSKIRQKTPPEGSKWPPNMYFSVIVHDHLSW